MGAANDKLVDVSNTGRRVTFLLVDALFIAFPMIYKDLTIIKSDITPPPWP